MSSPPDPPHLVLPHGPPGRHRRHTLVSPPPARYLLPMPATLEILDTSYPGTDSPRQPASTTPTPNVYDVCWAASTCGCDWQWGASAAPQNVVVDDRLAANPINRADPSGLCYKFTILVDAPGYKYDTLHDLLKSMIDRGMNGKMSTGHTWVRLEKDGEVLVEGGHTGENKNRARNSEITNSDFLTFTGGLWTLLQWNNNMRFWGMTKPNGIPGVPQIDAANPLAWLQYEFKDGEWHSGSGGHTATVQHEWDFLDDAKGERILDAIYSEMDSISTFGIDNNCTSTAAKIAAAGGIDLDPEVIYPDTVDHPDWLQQPENRDILPLGLGIFVASARLYTDPQFNKPIKFALTQKMADLLAGLNKADGRVTTVE
jgi:hypothetical protein